MFSSAVFWSNLRTLTTAVRTRRRRRRGRRREPFLFKLFDQSRYCLSIISFACFGYLFCILFCCTFFCCIFITNRADSTKVGFNNGVAIERPPLHLSDLAPFVCRGVVLQHLEPKDCQEKNSKWYLVSGTSVVQLIIWPNSIDPSYRILKFMSRSFLVRLARDFGCGSGYWWVCMGGGVGGVWSLKTGFWSQETGWCGCGCVGVWGCVIVHVGGNKGISGEDKFWSTLQSLNSRSCIAKLREDANRKTYQDEKEMDLCATGESWLKLGFEKVWQRWKMSFYLRNRRKDC